MSNESRILDQENKTYSGSSFDSQVEMVRLNGTAQHTHAITNFILTNSSQPNNIREVFNGTSTASLREGPVTDIPTSIKIMGDTVINIWLDPVKVKNHFGDTPIYGLWKRNRVHKCIQGLIIPRREITTWGGNILTGYL